MKQISLLAILCCFTSIGLAQKKIDGVVAIVGEKIVLQSAVESQLEQIKSQGYEQDEQILKCQILEELLYQKLLANKAQIDSLNVSDEEVNSAIDQRIAYFVGQIGSEQKLEEYFGKSINALREDFKPVFKEQMMAQRMESRITSDVKITPEDVRKFYYSIPKR